MDLTLARRGPVFAALDGVDLALWERVARSLEESLPDSPRKAERIHWLTVPVFLWLHRALLRSTRRPVMAGLSAPQGAGKSTLAKLLVSLLEAEGIRAVALSIDDFYLRREDQLKLAAEYPGNRFLEHRGYPGTHDVQLGVHTLEALREGRDVELPQYDKSAHGGRGDRSAVTRPVHGRFDLVLLEGWMLGFSPVPVRDPALEIINTKLSGYEAWHLLLDVTVCLRAKDPNDVLRWRTEAEDAARAAGRPALSPAEVDDYVRRFLPAYEHYTASADLTLTLDADRIPTG
jgi:D-glycerate 3-kinase